jgi:hypothetical protein
LHVLGGRDPEERWGRDWDGQWRMVLFDVPTGQNAQRERLRRYLRAKAFGYLQNSVWITPDPLKEERQIMGGARINVESLLLLEARPCAGESDTEIVAGAWDFERINRRYVRYLKVLEEHPTAALRNEWAAKVAAALGNDRARDLAARGDERSSAAGQTSTLRLSGRTGMASSGKSVARRQPTAPHLRRSQQLIFCCRLYVAYTT